MAKGTIAKEKVVDKLKEAFGKDFIGIFDKKCYVWSSENNEQIQVAISLTCPKNNVNVGQANASNVSEEVNTVRVEEKSNVMSSEERNTIEQLIKKFNL